MIDTLDLLRKNFRSKTRGIFRSSEIRLTVLRNLEIDLSPYNFRNEIFRFRASHSKNYGLLRRSSRFGYEGRKAYTAYMLNNQCVSRSQNLDIAGERL